MKPTVSGAAMARFMDDAMGFSDVENPRLSRGSLLRAAEHPQRNLSSVAGRWASFVIKTLETDADPRTISAWARTLGVSRTGLCECCRLVHITPRDARDFARLMRAVYQSGDRWQPETALDLADVRTLKKLLARAGLTGAETLAPTVSEFLQHQLLIPQSNSALMALKMLLFGNPDAAVESAAHSDPP